MPQSTCKITKIIWTFYKSERGLVITCLLTFHRIVVKQFSTSVKSYAYFCFHHQLLYVNFLYLMSQLHILLLASPVAIAYLTASNKMKIQSSGQYCHLTMLALSSWGLSVMMGIVKLPALQKLVAFSKNH